MPEFYGRPSHYTEGTGFLGTPKDHLDLAAKRPVSPHVFEIDGKSMHYKMPVNAISSIINRATGVALSAAITGAGAVALLGDLPSTVVAFKEAAPFLVMPVKAALAFPLVYHYVGGLRHIAWDKYSIGNMAEKSSLLDIQRVVLSSKIIIGTSVVGTLGLAVLSL